MLLLIDKYKKLIIFLEIDQNFLIFLFIYLFIINNINIIIIIKPSIVVSTGSQTKTNFSSSLIVLVQF